MSSIPFSTVALGLTLSVTDNLQDPAPQNPIVQRQISNRAYQANFSMQYEGYLRLQSTALIPLFASTTVPVVYVRNASASGVVNVYPTFNGASGAILTSTLGPTDPFHAPYAVGDTGIILGPNNNATYIITSVGAGPSFNVTGYTITNEGTGYSVSSGFNHAQTATGGAQPGTGSGFTINITSVGNSNTQQLVTLGPGGIFLYYQPTLDPASDNTIQSVSLASQNGALVLAEYLYAQ